MASNRINLTLTDEEVLFITERNLSPTQLLKEKVHEIMALSAHTEILLKDEIRKRNFWQAACTDLRNFIERKGLTDEMLKEGQK